MLEVSEKLDRDAQWRRRVFGIRVRPGEEVLLAMRGERGCVYRPERLGEIIQFGGEGSRDEVGERGQEKFEESWIEGMARAGHKGAQEL